MGITLTFGHKKRDPFEASYRFSRKRGDSNPRYGYPYVSLANWWFQPLTHTSMAAFLILRVQIYLNFYYQQNLSLQNYSKTI